VVDYPDPMTLNIVQIIEDEPLHAQLLDHSLRQARYRTNVAHDGVTGLADVMRLTPSLILLDLMLPGMNGQEVCRRIRSEPATKHIPIMMISALGSDEDRISGIRMGADDYVAKPFSPREVVSRAQALLRRSQAQWATAPCLSGSPVTIKDHCLQPKDGRSFGGIDRDLLRNRVSSCCSDSPQRILPLVPHTTRFSVRAGQLDPPRSSWTLTSGRFSKPS